MKTNSNMSRRRFLQTGGLALAALAVHPFDSLAAAAGGSSTTYKSLRPAPDKRHFTSRAVEAVIAETKPKIKDEKLRWMFENCFPNTLDTTVKHTVKNGKPDTFVITGITLPQGYILAAEDRLEKAVLDWMEDNSRPKPEYSLSLGQAFLARNPGIAQALGPDSRLMVEYDGKEVLLYVSQYTAQVTAGSPHPKVTVTLAENVSINTGGFRRQLGQVSDSVRAFVTADIPAIGSAFFMRKDIPDTVPSVPTFSDRNSDSSQIQRKVSCERECRAPCQNCCKDDLFHALFLLRFQVVPSFCLFFHPLLPVKRSENLFIV